MTHTRLLTVKEYSALMRIHPLTVYRRIREGQQSGVVKEGKTIRIKCPLGTLTHTHA